MNILGIPVLTGLLAATFLAGMASAWWVAGRSRATHGYRAGAARDEAADLYEALARAAERESVLCELVLELESLASTDALTGLLNRMSFDAALGRLCAANLEAGKAFGLLLIDVDHFKAINDTHGHEAGDVVLKWLAGALRGALRRPGDGFYRIGGEEFAILLPAAAADAVLIAERLRMTVASAVVPIDADRSVRLTVSIGVATQGADRASLPDPRRVFTHADKALYAAKRGGRDRVVVFGATDE